MNSLCGETAKLRTLYTVHYSIERQPVEEKDRPSGPRRQEARKRSN
jgi:hypothetical protein